MNKTQFLYSFIADQGLATISTIGPLGTPQSAVIGFGQTDNLEIIFGTDSSSRKYHNLLENPDVSLVIGWVEGKTVQYQGTARQLEAGEIQLVRDTYWVKSPRAERFSTNPGQRYFVVTPTWIRFTDTDLNPWQVVEMNYQVA